MSLHPEVLLALGYVVILAASAGGLEVAGWLTQRRAGRTRTEGFKFHVHHDTFECGEGHHLKLTVVDSKERVARYKAHPSACGGCPSKHSCTDDPSGREVVRSIDTWPRSEVGRFHRGFSLVLVAIAALIASVVLVRHHNALEAVVLSMALAMTLALAARIVTTLRATPANFPDRRLLAHNLEE